MDWTWLLAAKLLVVSGGNCDVEGACKRRRRGRLDRKKWIRAPRREMIRHLTPPRPKRRLEAARGERHVAARSKRPGIAGAELQTGATTSAGFFAPSSFGDERLGTARAAFPSIANLVTQ